MDKILLIGIIFVFVVLSVGMVLKGVSFSVFVNLVVILIIIVGIILVVVIVFLIKEIKKVFVLF